MATAEQTVTEGGVALQERLRGSYIGRERAQLRRGASGLQRDDRQAAGRDRALRRRRRRRSPPCTSPASSGLQVAVRSGGHNGAGSGSVDGGLVIDLSPMRGVTVDPHAQTVRVERRCLLGDVDHATHAFGLAVPAGIISTTGVGGLTLGGGLGHITRRCGLTIDNLLSAEIVLADGTLGHGERRRERDLFWALRGGGGNFGIVTSFDVPLPPDRERDRAARAVRRSTTPRRSSRWWRDFIPPSPTSSAASSRSSACRPGHHSRRSCTCARCAASSGATAATEDDPGLPARGTRVRSARCSTASARYRCQRCRSAFDAVYPPGDQWYWRGDFVKRDPRRGIARHVEYGAAMPTWKSHHAPVSDRRRPRASRPDATPWAYRDAKWAQVIVGVDPDPANADAIRHGARTTGRRPIRTRWAAPTSTS